jgi:translation initiation factor 5B
LDQTRDLAEQYKFTVRIPGLLIIDTPGHESFTNLRSRGSGLCDIAIVVVDFTKGLEPQTKESLNLLRDRKCSFIVAMNKVDRLYGWKAQPGKPIQASLKAQEKYVAQEYDTRVHNISSQLMAEGFNSALYYLNKDFRKVVSLVPVSAHTGEGIPDLLALVVQLIQKFMEAKVTVGDNLSCTVLEVKKTEGHGTTLDVILVNGTLRLGDTIVVCGFAGPIVTTIRSLMTPQPCKELRVRGEYMFHKEVRAALGVKVAAHDLDEAVAGTPLFVHTDETDLEALKSEVMKDLGQLLQNLDTAGRGVTVQASTLGSLEAILRFFKENNVPVAHIALGPVHKRHMMNTLIALERDPKNAVLLAFDVPITREAQEIADANNIKIFSADVIYKLFEMFQEHLKSMKTTTTEQNKTIAVFPTCFRILPDSVFRAADPIILGVEVISGQLRPGTPVFFQNEGGQPKQVGTVVGVEKDHTSIPISRVGAQVGVKIQPKDTSMTMGRHIPENAIFYSTLTRDSIDALKASFRDEMTKDDWQLVVDIKKRLEIM